jgi:hypothetical protein
VWQTPPSLQAAIAKVMRLSREGVCVLVFGVGEGEDKRMAKVVNNKEEGWSETNREIKAKSELRRNFSFEEWRLIFPTNAYRVDENFVGTLQSLSITQRSIALLTLSLPPPPRSHSRTLLSSLSSLSHHISSQVLLELHRHSHHHHHHQQPFFHQRPSSTTTTTS